MGFSEKIKNLRQERLLSQQFQLSMSMSLVLPGTIFREKELIF